MLFLILILTIYFATILVLIYGFSKIKSYNSIDLKPKTAFTIIVPFRNEAKNLPNLLSSFSKLNYPMDLFEVILVDDASDFRFQISDLKLLQSTILDFLILQRKMQLQLLFH